MSEIDPLLTNVFFYTPWKRQKTSGFLDFSDGMEVENWHEIGYVSTSNDCLQSV